MSWVYPYIRNISTNYNVESRRKTEIGCRIYGFHLWTSKATSLFWLQRSAIGLCLSVCIFHGHSHTPLPTATNLGINVIGTKAERHVSKGFFLRSRFKMATNFVGLLRSDYGRVEQGLLFTEPQVTISKKKNLREQSNIYT